MTSDALKALIDEAQAWPAGALFVALCLGAWNFREKFQRSPGFGYATGLACFGVGAWLFQHLVNTQGLAAMIASAGLMALGVSMIANALGVPVKASPTSCRRELEEKVEGMISKCADGIKDLRAAKMAEQRKQLLIDRETDVLGRLILFRQELKKESEKGDERD